MKFGDIVCNGWAADINPKKLMMFVRHGKPYAEFLSMDGKRIRHEMPDERVTVVLSRDTPHLFAEWCRLATELLARSDNP